MALTKDKNTRAKSRGPLTVYKVAANAVIYVGAMVAVNATGFLVPAANAAGLNVVGRANGMPGAIGGKADNTGGADGAKLMEVEEGIFKWANSGGSLVTQARVSLVCYVTDDETVQLAVGANSTIAGRVMELDADGGVWVSCFLAKP